MTITRQEIITSLHEPEKFILAIVEVSDGPRRRAALCPAALSTIASLPSTRTAIQFNLKGLLERAEVPGLKSAMIRNWNVSSDHRTDKASVVVFQGDVAGHLAPQRPFGKARDCASLCQ